MSLKHLSKTRSWGAIAAAALLFSFGFVQAGLALAAPPTYSVQGFIPDRDHAPETFMAVNEAGVVVGSATISGKSAMVTYANGVSTPLEGSARAFEAYINGNGDVVTTKRSDAAPFGSLAVLYAGGTRIRLPKMGAAAGINAKGQVVGVDSGFQRPAIYDNGVYRRLHMLDRGGAIPMGINDDGIVVGSNLDDTGRFRPTLWGVDGKPRYLGSVQNAGYGNARAINKLGQVTGCTDVLGCYLFGNEQFEKLPPAGERAWTDVRGITDEGVALGVGSNIDDLVYCQGESHLLEDLIVGGERGHWRLFAWAIGPAGHIVGSGIRDDMPQSFIATPVSHCTED